MNNEKTLSSVLRMLRGTRIIRGEEMAEYQRAATGCFLPTTQSPDGRYMNEATERMLGIWTAATEWVCRQMDPLVAAASQSQAAQPTELTDERHPLVDLLKRAIGVLMLHDEPEARAIGLEARELIDDKFAAHIAGTSQAPHQQAKQTDLAQRLRAIAAAVKPNDPALVTPKCLTDSADEIDRYYNGMLAWKQTAEKKDRDWNAERMGRVNDRIAAGTSQATKAQAEHLASSILDALFLRVTEAKKAAYTFGDTCREAVEIALDGVLDMIASAPVASVAKEATRDAADLRTFLLNHITSHEIEGRSFDRLTLAHNEVHLLREMLDVLPTRDAETTDKANVLPPTRGTDSQHEAGAAVLSALLDGMPLQEPVNITKAVLAQREARVSLSGGTGPVACAMLVNIQLTPWAGGPEKAEAFASGYNTAMKWYRAALLELAKKAGRDAASRCRAQGGITNTESGSDLATTTSTVSAPELAEMEARKDAAYLERNQVVAALAKCFPSGVARTAIEGWSEDWHGCVYIDLPTGQASWHFHDSQAYLFDGLPPYAGKWDGHTTEEKYERISRLATTTSTVSAPTEMREALRPFADLADLYDDARKNPPGFSGLLMRFRSEHKEYALTVNHLRAARAALSSTEGAQKAPEEVRNQALEEARRQISDLEASRDGYKSQLEFLSGDAVRNEALEEAAKVAEETDVVTFTHAMVLHDDGSQTRSDIAAAIRALRTSSTEANADTGSAA